MNLHGLAPLCIPINKTGKQAKGLSENGGGRVCIGRSAHHVSCRALLASPEWGYPRFGLEKDVYRKERRSAPRCSAHSF